MVAAGRARLALSSVARREAPRSALQRSSSASLEDAASFEEVRQDLRAIARFWFHERRATVPRRGYDCGLPLRVGDCLKQKPPVGGRCGDNAEAESGRRMSTPALESPAVARAASTSFPGSERRAAAYADVGLTDGGERFCVSSLATARSGSDRPRRRPLTGACSETRCSKRPVARTTAVRAESERVTWVCACRSLYHRASNGTVTLQLSTVTVSLPTT